MFNTIQDPDPTNEKRTESDPHKKRLDGKNSETIRDIFFIMTKTNRPYTALETKRKRTFKEFRNLAFRSKLSNIREQIFNK